MILDRVKTVAQSIGKHDEGMLNMCADCKLEWGMLTNDRLKSIQCALDRGSIISKIIEIEKNSNAQFECTHVKTKQDTEVIEDSDGKKMLLKCDNKAKYERIKCEQEHKNGSIWTRGKIGLKHRRRYVERKLSEVIKIIGQE